MRARSIWLQPLQALHYRLNSKFNCAFWLALSPPPLPLFAGLPVLHSLRSSPNILFLDFDGYTSTHEQFFGVFSASAYDPAQNGPAFSEMEVEQVIDAWARVAEDFAPFNMDVTTEVPPAINSTTIWVVVTSKHQLNGDPMPYASAGGEALDT